jgi:opacity protein-like surface antigen
MPDRFSVRMEPHMRLRLASLLAFLFVPLFSSAQQDSYIPYEISAGYSYLSNSFNGVPGSKHPLNGFDASAVFPADWHHLRFKLDYSMYRGTNLDAPQHSFFILGGGQYEVMLHRERLFAEALVGEGGLNQNWGAKGSPGGTASFTAKLGGGADTPIGRHFAIRVEGNVLHTNFNPLTVDRSRRPYHMDGLPNYFGSLSAGLVWMPRVESRSTRAFADQTPPESEVVFEALNSFGHFHIFANSWWSYLTVAGVEYDRHSLGRFIGARRDYTAEILPVVILRQPSKTDVWGNQRSKTHETVPGLAISPIGMRLIWRDGKQFKPYYIIKGGMIGFTKKSFSQYASYESFTLQQGLGVQFKVTDRWDFRTAFEVFHTSNGFVVPSNPGLDSMMYTGGLCYHLGKRTL